nr:TetR/AcrR family transcriptional regulator [Fusibacter paucivorans]
MELSRKKPLSTVTVRDIVHAAGYTRNTFYYHFQDKQDLINWIYKTTVQSSIGAIDQRLDTSIWRDAILKLLQELEAKKYFYENALKMTGQNSFYDYLFETTYNHFSNVIELYLQDKSIDDDTIEFFINFYSHAYTEMTTQWLRSGAKIPADKFMHLLTRATLHGLYKNLNYFS